jgi:hypothetical protein
LSLKAALEELGFFRCYHMEEVFKHPDHPVMWSAASRGEPVDWDALFEGYQATVDWPSCAFYQELMRRYPDAMVILTVRDPQKWYESARETIFYASEVFPKWGTWLVPPMRRLVRMIHDVIWQGAFQGRFSDRTHALAVFNRHNEEVRRVVPAERLLVYEVKQGWEPLCAFLGAPVPSGKPFPHLNDGAQFRSRIRRVAWTIRITGYTVLALILAGLAWLLIHWLR